MPSSRIIITFHFMDQQQSNGIFFLDGCRCPRLLSCELPTNQQTNKLKRLHAKSVLLGLMRNLSFDIVFIRLFSTAETTFNLVPLNPTPFQLIVILPPTTFDIFSGTPSSNPTPTSHPIPAMSHPYGGCPYSTGIRLKAYMGAVPRFA